jgi:hypothetical protein
MARISPICKKFKIFISALKSPTYRDFMIKKIMRIQEIKISHLSTFKDFFYLVFCTVCRHEQSYYIVWLVDVDWMHLEVGLLKWACWL